MTFARERRVDASERDDAWIAYHQRDPRARLRLFCFPHAGGAASTYRDWNARFPPEVEVCCVQFPGRETRLKEAPISDMPTLVRRLSDGLAPYLDLPFALFGHSMGALVSFELARFFRREKHILPVALSVSGCPAPQTFRKPELCRAAESSDEDLLCELAHLGGTPYDVLSHQDFVEMYLPVLRADLRVLDRYVYRAEDQLYCHISALCGDADTEVTCDEVRAWSAQAGNSFSFHVLPGDHFYLTRNRQKIIESLVPILTKHLG